MSEEERWLFLNGEVDGPHSVTKIVGKLRKGSIDKHSLFYSTREQKWLEIFWLMEDLNPTKDQIQQWKQVGIKRVFVMAGGRDEECAACAAIVGKNFAIEFAPEIPPKCCMCDPWSKIMLGATSDTESQ